MIFLADVYAWHPTDGVRRLSAGNGVYYQACVNPEGTYAVYSGAAEGAPRLWRTDLRSGVTVALTPDAWSAFHPVYSWDGTRIAFCADRDFPDEGAGVERLAPNGMPPTGGPHSIYVADKDGGEIARVTSERHQDQRPAFSPDGSRIAFASLRSGTLSLWETASNGRETPRPLLDGGMGYRPWYGRDGRWIYFIGEHEGRHHICKVPSRGGQAIPLSYEGFEESHGPFVDHSGGTLLMHAKRGGAQGIWELPLSGGVPRALSPPGFPRAAHPTRALNRTIVFDVPRTAKQGAES